MMAVENVVLTVPSPHFDGRERLTLAHGDQYAALPRGRPTAVLPQDLHQVNVVRRGLSSPQLTMAEGEEVGTTGTRPPIGHPVVARSDPVRSGHRISDLCSIEAVR